MRVWILIGSAILAIMLLISCCFTVDRAEFGYLTLFGKPVAVLDGATEAGLHFKLPWPIQSVRRVDRRLQFFDLPATELLTKDPKGDTIDKTLTVSAYVCWRIADKEGADRFLRTVGIPDRAEAILGQRITSRLGAEVGTMRLEDLISVAAPAEAGRRLDRLSQDLLNGRQAGDSLKDSARDMYGIELVDVRLRRFSYPSQVRDAIFDRIRSERNRKVADYQSEGMQLAESIRSQAEYEARTILAEAKAAEQRIKSQAEADADRIRSTAHAHDPEFYAFLKKLAEYQRILGDNKSTLLLSSHRELFDLLYKPPSPSVPMSKNGVTAQHPESANREGKQ